MATTLGLVSSETISPNWALNNRRRIFHDFPNGPAPLTGLLSLMDGDPTPYPNYKWEEQRYLGIQTTVATGPTSNVPFYLTGTTTTAGTPATFTAGQVVRMYVVDATAFQQDNTLQVFGVQLTGGTTVNLVGLVTLVNTTGLNYIEFRVTTAPSTTVINSGTSPTSIGLYVVAQGSAYAEGARTRTGRATTPFEIDNNTQIHKTSFEMTGTALKEPLKYDKSGAYRELFALNGRDHLAGLEWTSFFGQKDKTTAVDPDTGQTVSRRLTGGLKYFIDRYEAGTDYGLPNIAASAWQTTPGKRNILLGGAAISAADWNSLTSRVFEKTYSADYSKLCLCGSEFYNRVSTYYEGRVNVTAMRDDTTKDFNFMFDTINVNGGKMAFKVHPLFNDLAMPFLRNAAFIIDLGAISWRPLTDRDTDLYPMVQANDADKRKDMWLTEGGLEVRFPESLMYIQDLGGITK